jgi:hypothetical protein
MRLDKGQDEADKGQEEAIQRGWIEARMRLDKGQEEAIQRPL